MKKGKLCIIIIGICVILLASCTDVTTQAKNSMYTSIALENEINVSDKNIQTQVVDLTEKNFDIDNIY